MDSFPDTEWRSVFKPNPRWRWWKWWEPREVASTEELRALFAAHNDIMADLVWKEKTDG